MRWQIDLDALIPQAGFLSQPAGGMFGNLHRTCQRLEGNARLCGKSGAFGIVCPNIDADPPFHHVAYWLDVKKLTVWWVHFKHGRPDYITCIRKWPTDRGFVAGPVDRDCGKNKGACAAQAREMVGIKF
jgi:hypothetical protein